MIRAENAVTKDQELVEKIREVSGTLPTTYINRIISLCRQHDMQMAIDTCIKKAVALGRDSNFLSEEYESGYYQCRLEILESLQQVQNEIKQ